MIIHKAASRRMRGLAARIAVSCALVLAPVALFAGPASADPQPAPGVVLAERNCAFGQCWQQPWQQPWNQPLLPPWQQQQQQQWLWQQQQEQQQWLWRQQQQQLYWQWQQQQWQQQQWLQPPWQQPWQQPVNPFGGLLSMFGS